MKMTTKNRDDDDDDDDDDRHDDDDDCFLDMIVNKIIIAHPPYKSMKPKQFSNVNSKQLKNNIPCSLFHFNGEPLTQLRYHKYLIMRPGPGKDSIPAHTVIVVLSCCRQNDTYHNFSLG